MSIRTFRIASAALALAAASLASTAFAADEFAPANNELGVKIHPAHPVPSTMTRAEVKAKLNEARADGSFLDTGDDPDYPHPVGGQGKAKTREQVKREYQAWRANPVTPDGFRQIPGDVGMVYQGR